MNCFLCVDYNFQISDYIIVSVVVGIIIIYAVILYKIGPDFYFSLIFQNNSDRK